MKTAGAAFSPELEVDASPSFSIYHEPSAVWAFAARFVVFSVGKSNVCHISTVSTVVIAVTVTVVEPEILPDVAVIVADPLPTAAASPLLPAALLMVATLVFDELHVADVVMSCELLLE